MADRKPRNPPVIHEPGNAPAFQLGLSGLTKLRRTVYIFIVVKIKAPLMSLGASGLVGAVSYLTRQKTKIAEKTPVVPDAKTLAQLSWRHMYQKAVALWHALSASEKQEWESLARPKHMTGFAWFMSQCLRPNPGIYLPLQGGTMQGEIDMAKYRIRRLPVPEGAQDPLRVHEYNTAIAPFLYNEGAHVYHDANQAIPNITVTTIAFNSERYDTDAIHDNVTNNSRLTCKTAGKYIIIGLVHFAPSLVGVRSLRIILNVATEISLNGREVDKTGQWFGSTSVIYDLSVGDYVYLRAFQSSGGALNVTFRANSSPEFMMQRIGA